MFQDPKGEVTTSDPCPLPSMLCSQDQCWDLGPGIQLPGHAGQQGCQGLHLGQENTDSGLWEPGFQQLLAETEPMLCQGQRWQEHPSPPTAEPLCPPCSPLNRAPGTEMGSPPGCTSCAGLRDLTAPHGDCCFPGCEPQVSKPLVLRSPRALPARLPTTNKPVTKANTPTRAAASLAHIRERVSTQGGGLASPNARVPHIADMCVHPVSGWYPTWRGKWVTYTLSSRPPHWAQPSLLGASL